MRSTPSYDMSGHQSSSVYLVQLSDLHLFTDAHQSLLGVVTEQTFQSVLQATLSLAPAPDAIVLTGDLSQDGSAAAYKRLKHYMNQTQIDTYWLAGNHDRWQPLSVELQGHCIFQDKQFSRGSWTVILISTLLEGQESGHLSEDSLQFLYQSLTVAAQQQQYVLVSLHHPPFLVQSSWLDQSTLQAPERLFEILDQFPNVRLVIFGHIHQDFQRYRHGVAYLGCPSTCIQFKPMSHQFELERLPPAYRQLWLHNDGTFSTQIARVPAGFQEPDLHYSGY